MRVVNRTAIIPAPTRVQRSVDEIVAVSLACPRCRGRLRLIALIEHATVIQRILRHLGLPAEIRAPCAARAPPLPIDRGACPVDAAGTTFDPCS